MSSSLPPEPAAVASPRRRAGIAIAVFGVAVIGVLALAIVPINGSSERIDVLPGTSATASVSIPHAGWVTVHYDHPYRMGMGMHTWMQGPSGTMFDHSMMSGADTYSFWTWGGTYECGAGYVGTGSGMMPIWINATWGAL